MCPYEPRDFEAPSSADILPYYRDSGKDSVNINIPEDLYDVSDVSLQRLTVLMESNDSASMIQRVEQQYGSVQNLCNNLGSSITDGLKDRSDLLATRIATYGRNIIPVKKSKSFLRLLLHALKEPTLVILEVAAVVSLAMSIWNLCRPIAGEIDPGSSYEWIESVAILTAVVVIVLVTAVNDYSKEVQFRTLQNRVKEENKTTVIRDGVVKPLPAHELVVGDICLLEYGVIVPADGLLFQGHELLIDESSVTGESEPAKKIPSSDILLLSGTHVVQGSGKMLVTAVGLNSHIGSVYKLLGVVKGHKTIAENGQKNNTVTNQSEEFPPPSPPDFCLDGLPNYRNGGESSPAGAMGGVRKTKEKEESVFQAKLQTLAIRIGIIGLIFASATSTVIIIRFCVEQYVVGKKSWKTEDATTILDSIIVGITILVSAIPEGLPLAVTLTLAFSTKKMMQDNNLVRHLFACETMGCATTICSDKTGTLTTNRMTVTKVWFGEQLVDVSGQGTQTLNAEFLDLLCTAMAVNSAYSSEIVPDKLHPSALPVQRGNRTECALLQFITLAGKDYGKIRDMYPQDDFVKLFPFNSSRKSMLTVVRIPTGWRVFCKGAAEIVLKNCLEYVSGQTNEKTLLTSELGDYITDTVISQMASNALRTICVAYKDISFPMDENSDDNAIQHAELFDDDEFLATDLVCLGIFGIEDPVRPEVPGAIKKCQRAGITVRMVTGDNVLTARSIAAKCGIIKPGDDSLVLEEKEFNRLIRDKSGEVDQKMFDSIIPRLRVLARSTPKGKYTLVEGIINSRTSNHREVVAVTGDGTNDAPALKRADVGFAMGISGTDVAKEASDIILMDDNFVSLVKACMWGRNIYDNVAKFLQFQLTVNIAALSVAIISACVLGDTPLKAVPMLWINMIQDTLGSLALATEPPTEELLKRKPYGRNKRIISRTLAKNIIGQGVYQSVILLALLFAGPKWFDLEESYDAVGHVNGEPSVLYTLIFNALVMMTTFNLLNARCIHGETNMFRGIFNNLYFVAIFGLMFLIQIIVVEFGGYAFATKPLPLEMWAISFLVGIGSLLWYYVIRLIPTKIRRPNKH